MAIQSKDTIAKLGNAMTYLAAKIPSLSKTKLLKLLYLLEECSIKKFNSPFFWVDFQIWMFGPVVKEVYIDLDNDRTDIFQNYIGVHKESGVTIIKSISDFDDGEFSDNDIEILEYVLSSFGMKTAKELVTYTHDANSAWGKQTKETGLDYLFENKISNSSEVNIDFSYYLSGCSVKIYNDICESRQMFEDLK